MRTVLTLACLLAVAHQIAAQCNFVQYTTTFTPQCSPDDIYVKWPDYENPSYYWTCNGIGNPALVACPFSQYFAFALQVCTTCSQYIPAVECKYLKTQYPPNCVAIGSGGSTGGPGPTGPTLPTPNYPDTTTAKTTVTTAKTTVTTAKTTVTTQGSTAPTGPTVPTPPTGGTGSTGDIPPPPSPVTPSPGIPTPPTPDPTPPNVPATPPNIPSPPVVG